MSIYKRANTDEFVERLVWNDASGVFENIFQWADEYFSTFGGGLASIINTSLNAVGMDLPALGRSLDGRLGNLSIDQIKAADPESLTDATLDAVAKTASYFTALHKQASSEKLVAKLTREVARLENDVFEITERFNFIDEGNDKERERLFKLLATRREKLGLMEQLLERATEKYNNTADTSINKIPIVEPKKPEDAVSRFKSLLRGKPKPLEINEPEKALIPLNKLPNQKQRILFPEVLPAPSQNRIPRPVVLAFLKWVISLLSNENSWLGRALRHASVVEQGRIVHHRPTTPAAPKELALTEKYEVINDNIPVSTNRKTYRLD